MFPLSLLYLNNLGLKGRALKENKRHCISYKTVPNYLQCTGNRLLPRQKQSQDVDGEPYCLVGQKKKKKRCLCFNSLNPEEEEEKKETFFLLDKAACGFHK